jgi:hypothetical protein
MLRFGFEQEIRPRPVERGLDFDGRPLGLLPVYGLKANPQAQFDISRLSLAKSSERTKALDVVETKVIIGPLIMVDHVSEDALEFQADAFRYTDILLDAEIHIPVGQPTEYSSAAVPGI